MWTPVTADHRTILWRTLKAVNTEAEKTVCGNNLHSIFSVNWRESEREGCQKHSGPLVTSCPSCGSSRLSADTSASLSQDIFCSSSGSQAAPRPAEWYSHPQRVPGFPVISFWWDIPGPPPGGPPAGSAWGGAMVLLRAPPERQSSLTYY